jgi:LysM repeat protein
MKPSAGGPERYVLALALLVPLGFALLLSAQLPGMSLAAPYSMLPTGSGPGMISKRPVGSSAAPPPTLVAPTVTPRPTATLVPGQAAVVSRATAAPTPLKGGTYTVQPGDELKHIAADYNVSIWKIIAANDIPDPDSLRIGQELHIPSD